MVGNSPPIGEMIQTIIFDTLSIPDMRLAEVGELFQEDFPNNEEYPAIPVTFEILGVQAGNLGSYPQLQQGKRYWFLSGDEHYVIQFQQNMLCLNWRSLNKKEANYPGYAHLQEKFAENVRKLSSYLEENKKKLNILQCELAYINARSVEEGVSLSDYVAFSDKFSGGMENILFAFTKRYVSPERKSSGRLHSRITFPNSSVNSPTLNFLLHMKWKAEKDPMGSFDNAHAFLRESYESLARPLYKGE